MNHIVEKNYQINLAENGKSIKLAFIADLHIGSGMHKKDLVDMVKLINNSNVEALLIAGDLVDSSTGINDMNNLKLCLECLKMPIYYVEGNHETDCIYEYKKILKEFNVEILEDKCIKLDDGLILIGRDNKTILNTDEIIDQYGKNNSYIIMQHSPRNLNNIDLDNSIIIAGHTHGYQFPYINPSAVLFNVEYGHVITDEYEVLVTSGVSVWGHHSTFPSKNEIIIMEVNY